MIKYVPLAAAALIAAAGVAPKRVSAEADQAPVSRPLAAASIPLEQLCGPRASTAKPEQKIIIAAGSERVKTSYGPSETVVLNAGTSQGVKPGQRFLVRRVIDDQFAEQAIGSKSFSIHTAGWVTILDAQADAAVAQITEACDTVLIGDYLEPFVIPSGPPSPPPVVIQADYARPARVILGDERRQLGGEGVVMVLDRGSDHGIRVGQPLTIFRYTLPGRNSGPIATLAEAVVIEVHPETSLMRIARSREAVEVGDLVAIHR